MKFANFARPLKPLVLPLAFGLSLGLLTACSDEKEKEGIQQKLDLERERAEQLEAAKNEATRTVQKLEASTRDLEKNLNAQGQALAETQRSLDTANRSLEEKSTKVNELTASIAAKDSVVKQLESDLAAKNNQVAEIDREIARSKATIAELQKALASSSGNGSQELSAQLAAKIKEKEQLEAELAGVKAEKEKASAQLASTEVELNKLKSDHAALSASLEDAAYSGVMALLENPSPESLFGVTDWVLRETYKIGEDQECLMIFNIDREIESVVRDRSRSVPSIRGLQLVPLRTAYQKVAVCSKNGVTQAHKESGFIYKGIPSDNAERRVLVTTRNESSCDKLSEDVKSQNIFSSQFQLFYPYVGQIDGIETVNVLRPSNQVLEYNMGSSHPGLLASSCQAVLADSAASPLASTACRLAKGEKAENLNVSLGCFTEKQADAQTQLIFNK